MPDILLRDVPVEVADYWKRRAKENHRSLQQELQSFMREEEERVRRAEDSRNLVDEYRSSFAGRAFSDSAELIREDRDSDYGRDA